MNRSHSLSLYGLFAAAMANRWQKGKRKRQLSKRMRTANARFHYQGRYKAGEVFTMTDGRQYRNDGTTERARFVRVRPQS